MSDFRPLTDKEIAERRGVVQTPADLDAARHLIGTLEVAKAVPTDPTKRVLQLSPEDRKRIANVLMVQPPESQHDIDEFQKFMREHARVEGLPSDVLIRLEVLADLAEKGNVTAGWVYTEECKELGITFPRRFTFTAKP